MSHNSSSNSPRVVVMTGATSGIGAAALEQIAREPDTQVLVGARGSGRAVPAGVETLPLDLNSLASVREFADAVTRRLEGRAIDALVLNAGTQSRNLDGRTADGFETTFGVNHLAHYLLARLLAPHLADKARLILTTSDTHDPAITPLGPKSLDPQALADPPKSGLGAGMRAYAASKLCNLLTARSLADTPELNQRGITVLGYNPGFTGGTNLGDASPGARRVMGAVVFPVFSVVGRFKPAYAMGRPERAGQVLAELATGAVTPPAGRTYVSLVKGDITYPDPSELALNDDVRDGLWEQSAEMVGLSRT
ncbi:SDR family NAD(P)-dependent oxidoreductase [Streptomyces blattellae]|uniref:SDR family NAD(P)-dependent oxidoreductase n=1 Tax=Streptomyces blattellae TaxID=2569855 RepID=UPI0018ACFADE|nr:SDR family NAD(P)-dependent oxidoreductase [Streptomyces blattellae]